MQDPSSESHAALERLRGAPKPVPAPEEAAAAPRTPDQDDDGAAAAEDPVPSAARTPADDPAPAPSPAPPQDAETAPAPDASPASDADAPADVEADVEAPAPRVARPRRALAAPGQISRRDLRRHERALRTGRPETADARRVREGRRTDVHQAMERLRTPGAPAEQRPRRDLSDILDRLGSPDLARFTAPLVGTVERILPAPSADPQKAAQAARRREEAEARRRARLQSGRERAAESARRRAAEHDRLAAEAAEREAALRDDDARSEARRADEEAAAAKEARRQERLRERRTARRAAAEERARLAAEAVEADRERERREAEEAAAAAAREEAALQARLQEEARARQERAEQEERRAQERAAEEARLEQAARIARRRREEERERQRREAERRRRLAQEAKARAAADQEERRQQEQERRRREAKVAEERARVQAERRAREEAELAERERRRLEAEAEAERRRQAAEAERRRREAERAEAERRARAEEAERRRQEAERRRREAEEAARRAAEARRLHAERTRAHTVLHAERALAQARLLEDRARDAERRAAEEEARRLREHQDRESRALYRAARELEGPEVIPAASQRPLLARPEEGLTDEELVARARQALPEWRHRQRLATKARAVGAETAAGRSAGPSTGPVPLIPGYTPAAPEEPAGPATVRDRRGQLVLTLVWAAFVLAGVWGLGLFRFVPGLDALDAGPYPAAGDGRHGSGATVFSLFPLHPVIWPVLWLLTGLHVARQWGPGQGAAPRHRRTRGPMAGALLALALWFPLTVLVPWGLESALWLVALSLMLGAVRRLGARPAAGRLARLAEDGAPGVLLGTLLAGAPTALAATLHPWGVHVGWFPTELVAALVLLALLPGAVRLVLGGRGRMGVAVGMAWTLLCLALPRLLPSPLGAQQSAWVGFAAAFGALLLLTAAAVRRSWVRQIERDAARRPLPAVA
ncbi:hypothetical protein HDA33_001614 [Micrococcus endophyticus]|uniref:Uncharacterized protein n=1 Tax=Micrococcus endophyticus TaxID=455343 RepID=A0A7W9JJG7_9MICC|nr:hypothetical protein [Micrococcus endophyticus]MBB5849050.1 hypothetical protein [Micrococcus endophyticus]